MLSLLNNAGRLGCGMYVPEVLMAVITPWLLLVYHIIGVVADSWCLWPCHRPQQPVLEAAIVTVRRCWSGGMYVPDSVAVDDAMTHGYCWFTTTLSWLPTAGAGAGAGGSRRHYRTMLGWWSTSLTLRVVLVC